MPHIETTEASPLDMIAQEAFATTASFGITCAGDMVQALIERIVKRVGGQKIYIPSVSASEGRRRSAQIRAQFVGNNLQELARTYSITPRQVRRLLAQSSHVSQSKRPGVDLN